MSESGDFFSRYLEYTGGSEVPATFNRWSAIGMLGAMLGRQVYFKYGGARFHTNMYIMLLGSPGTKKNTAINNAKRLLKGAGYTRTAAEKTSKEKFLLDLAEIGGDESSLNNFLDQELWADCTESDYREIWIAKGEFNDFFANNILDFVSMLGELWDFEGVYENRIKNGQSVTIPNPTISILGGNTQTAFAAAFPPEAVGQGFFSRVLAIYSRPNGVKITWPRIPEPSDTDKLVHQLQHIKNSCLGEATFTPTAKKLVEKIYTTWKPVSDPRFESYSQRRLTHLIKLCMIIACSDCRLEMTERDVVKANTLLTHAEHFMPKAYGDFGAAKTSQQNHKIIQVLEDSLGMSTQDLWKVMQSDFDRVEVFMSCLSALVHAGKIAMHKETVYPVKKVIEPVINDMLDYGYLTQEEIDL